jgi:hypothetical protein
VITPRRTRLRRVPDLHAFRRAIVAWQSAIRDPQSAIIVVPSSGAARQLRRSLRDDRGQVATRDELYDRLHERLANPPRRLTAMERDVIAQAAARSVAQQSEPLSFQLRPGLVAEMLRFYDHLRRQSQQVDRFEELIEQALGSDEVDRGVARMRAQTAFLAGTFREYERRVEESTAIDEHGLRDRLVSEAAVDPIRHVLVSVADWIGDPAGLYSADFDLLTRVAGLDTLEIVCTEAVLRTGFHERLHTWWPGLEEVTGVDGGAETTAGRDPQPVLVTPPGSAVEEPWWTVRDREEELVAIARQIKAADPSGQAVPLIRTAVVFKAPLPYLYLAAEVFGASGIAYEAFDALPLAAEPTVAALDLVLDAVAANFTRSTLIALVRSPHFVFTVDGAAVTRESISALDRSLSHARYLGDPARLDDLPSSAALQAARQATLELLPLAQARPASAHVHLLREFWTSRLRPLEDADPLAARERRAREALSAMLEALEMVHLAHDDPEWTIRELALAVRRSIEEQTFVPAPAVQGGVQLLDDQAARYGSFDDVAIVGLIDPDWPERPRRNRIGVPPRTPDLSISSDPPRVERSCSRLRSTRMPSSRARCSSTRSRAPA